MARETKEERQARQALEEQARLVGVTAFKATLPMRLMAAQTLASCVSVPSTVSLTATGPSIHFGSSDYSSGFDDTLTYESEEWEVEHVERKLRDLKEEQEARQRRRGIADDVWKNKLTADEKAALKEFISYLY